MTYASPAWEFVADAHLMKLQRLQNTALTTHSSQRKLTSVQALFINSRTTQDRRNHRTIREVNLIAVK
jgi:hypothetical protein